VVKGLDMGADWYLTKPFQPGEIALLARRFLAELGPTSAPECDPTNGSPKRGEREHRLVLHWHEIERIAVPA
jgi:DNA-binding response OmpR family regulator